MITMHVSVGVKILQQKAYDMYKLERMRSASQLQMVLLKSCILVEKLI